MKNSIIKIKHVVAGCLIVLASASCMEERELRYTGPTVVEFKNHLFGRVASYLPEGVLPNASGSPMTLLSKSISVDERGVDSVLVQLIGPQLSNDAEIEFSISEESSAVEGEHFEFVNPGTRTFTIPANSSSGYIVYEVIPGSVADGESVALILNLIGNNQIGISKNYSAFTTRFQP